MSVEAIFCTREFYTLSALETLVGKNSLFGMKSHEKLIEDITAYKTVLVGKISRMLWDYSTLAVFGEMRHAKGRTDKYNPNIPVGGSREGSYDKAKEYTPESIFKAAFSLYSLHWKGGGYGGKAWLNIAKCVSKRNIMTPSVFCDMCFSLSHNSSIYLDKKQANIFDISNGYDYKSVLDYKFSCIRLTDLIQNFMPYTSKILIKLIMRAETLNLTNEKFDYYIPIIKKYDADSELLKVLNYIPIQWGENTLEDKLISENIFDFCDKDCDDDEDEKEDEKCEEESMDILMPVYKVPYGTKTANELDALLSFITEPKIIKRGAA
jgi:hypothetical protein